MEGERLRVSSSRRGGARQPLMSHLPCCFLSHMHKVLRVSRDTIMTDMKKVVGLGKSHRLLVPHA